jgi:hypothetical protein
MLLAVANFKCIAATGKSIERVLKAGFAASEPIDNNNKATAALVRSRDFTRDSNAATVPARGVAIFLYRVEVNPVMRAALAHETAYDGQTHLPIDLHYLLIPFASNAEHEQQIAGRAMQCLDETPTLSGPLLYNSGDWAPEEAIHVIPEDLGLDQVMRTFDSLEVDFSLCLPYMARVVRLDGASAIAPPAPSTVLTGIKPSAVP